MVTKVRHCSGPFKDVVKVTLLLEPEQDSRLAEAAFQQSVSRSKIVRVALREYFDRQQEGQTSA